MGRITACGDTNGEAGTGELRESIKHHTYTMPFMDLARDTRPLAAPGNTPHRPRPSSRVAFVPLRFAASRCGSVDPMRGAYMAVPALRGGQVAVLRRAARLTQADVASRLDVAQSRISAWESGLEQPQARHLKALAAALRVDAVELLEVDPTDPPLAALRAAAGLTVADVVEATGLPHTTYLQREQGQVQAELPARAVEVLAHALGVPSSQVRAAVARSRSDERAEQLLAAR